MQDSEQNQDNEQNADNTDEHNSNAGYSRRRWVTPTVVACIMVGLFFLYNNSGGLTTKAVLDDSSALSTDSDIVVIEEYSDFQCPFCKKALPTIKQLKELYGDKIQFEYKHFPLDFHKDAQKAAEASECARDQGKFWEYHDKLFENQQSLGVESLKSYAEEIGLDTGKFNSCLDNGEKTQLVKEQMLEGQGKGVSGTPAFIIGGQLISGAQEIEVFIQVIDMAIGEDSGILDELYADEPEIDFTVVNDKECGECDPAQIVQTTYQLFPKINLVEVDVNSAEGKSLVEKHSLKKVPSFIFSSNLVEASQYKENTNIKGAFLESDDSYILKDEVTGATRFIDPEKQAAFEAELAEQAKETMEKLGIGGDKPQIDFFVMSYCPYGNQAEEGIEKVYQELKDKAVFMPRYVIYSNYQGGGPSYCLDEESKYCSMHGIQELNQNIRERCVYELDGTGAFFEFTLAMNKDCNSKNADSCWVGVAEELELDVDAISQCEKERGLEFVKEGKELNDILGVSGSPTIFINGEKFAGSRTSEGYLAAVCAEFDEKPSECDNAIEPVVQQVPAAGGCGG